VTNIAKRRDLSPGIEWPFTYRHPALLGILLGRLRRRLNCLDQKKTHESWDGRAFAQNFVIDKETGHGQYLVGDMKPNFNMPDGRLLFLFPHMESFGTLCATVC
jgi:hypothetical protein